MSTSLRYMCGQFHVVTVTFVAVPQNSIVRAFSSEDREPCEQHLTSTCSDGVFHRDDIDNEAAQNGFKSMTIGPVVRKMFLAKDHTVMLWKERVRICTDQSIDPYLIGFASTFREALCWVATGKAKLHVPWEKA